MTAVHKTSEMEELWSDRASRNFVNAQWCLPKHGYDIDVYGPATMAELGSIPRSAIADVNHAAALARRVSKSVNLGDIALDKVGQLTDLIEGHTSHIARLECADSGIPIYDADAMVNQGLESIRQLRAKYASRTGEAKQPGCQAIILPSYAPFWMYCHYVADALLCGNAAILKPSSVTPMTATYFAALIDMLDLPAGAFALLQGKGRDVGAALCTNPDVSKISFAGSLEKAAEVRRAVKDRPIVTDIRCGGLNPALITETVPDHSILRHFTNNSLTHAGQAGFATRWYCIQANRFTSVVDAIGSLLNNSERSKCFGPSIAPLVSQHRLNKAQRFAETLAQDHEISRLGKQPKRNTEFPMGYFFETSLVVNPDRAALQAGEDLPAPFVFLSSFESAEDLVELLSVPSQKAALHTFSPTYPKAKKEISRCVSHIVEHKSGEQSPTHPVFEP